MTVRRLVEVGLALAALALASPLLVVAALGIRLASPGPLFYRARRVGRDGRVFTMLKLRTMHVAGQHPGSAITAPADPRVFAFGGWLRRMKIDELPQLINIIKGDMSFIGPRPEDPEIVARYYEAPHLETLRVSPGLASPGSLYNYTHGEQVLGHDDPERHYAERLLPLKLALDTVYIREASLLYDLRIIFRTLKMTAAMALGRRRFAEPPEMEKARSLLGERDWREETRRGRAAETGRHQSEGRTAAV